MKRNLVIGLLILSITTVSCSSTKMEKCKIPKDHYTEDMPPLEVKCKSVKVVFDDTVDGRPTFNVVFPDGKVVESMYPEEIANGLSTGNWLYNEDYKITTAN